MNQLWQRRTDRSGSTSSSSKSSRRLREGVDTGVQCCCIRSGIVDCYGSDGFDRSRGEHLLILDLGMMGLEFLLHLRVDHGENDGGGGLEGLRVLVVVRVGGADRSHDAGPDEGRESQPVVRDAFVLLTQLDAVNDPVQEPAVLEPAAENSGEVQVEELVDVELLRDAQRPCLALCRDLASGCAVPPG